MPEDKQELIVIKRIKKGHAGHHGGSWKVAFADFATSMMAFFLVMWLIAQPPDIKEHIAGYFQDPSGYEKGGYKSILKGKGSSLLDMKSNKNSLKLDLERKKRERKSRNKLQKAAEKIVKKLQQMPAFKMLAKQIEIQMTAEGLRIQLIESQGQAFFAKGSSELLPATKLLLKTISNEISKLPNKVLIEGHTDNVRYATDASYNNWDLSSDRANSARQWMETHGLRPDQITEVRGFAYTQPKIQNDPSDPRNRRIAIIIVNQYSGHGFMEKNVLMTDDVLAKEEKDLKDAIQSTETESIPEEE